MKNIIFTAVLAAFTLATSCSKEQKRRGLDYDLLKQELALDDSQKEAFDEVAAKIKSSVEEVRTASTDEGGKLDRVPFFTKMEELYKVQEKEMGEFLSDGQMVMYKEFMEANTRKRSRYNDELLAEMKSSMELDEEQSKVLEAANNAFEKEFQDAHDIYHGNSELAAEYFEKFDNQRRAAIESVLTEEQIPVYRELADKAHTPVRE